MGTGITLTPVMSVFCIDDSDERDAIDCRSIESQATDVTALELCKVSADKFGCIDSFFQAVCLCSV